MMEQAHISAHGLKQIEDDLKEALKREQDAEESLNRATERVNELREALACDHSELEDAGGYIYMQTRCKKCGYIWHE